MFMLHEYIAHLLFTDDCIILSESLKRGAEILMEIIDCYRIGSSQLVNKTKSEVSFSVQTGELKLNRETLNPWIVELKLQVKNILVCLQLLAVQLTKRSRAFIARLRARLQGYYKSAGQDLFYEFSVLKRIGSDG
uniref:Reverse transcriptase domain-containing protein n=1 Tax=Arundo donax TaxID=35708 RepID=A0A0A8XNA4_ARUDO